MVGWSERLRVGLRSKPMREAETGLFDGDPQFLFWWEAGGQVIINHGSEVYGHQCLMDKGPVNPIKGLFCNSS